MNSITKEIIKYVNERIDNYTGKYSNLKDLSEKYSNKTPEKLIAYLFDVDEINLLNNLPHLIEDISFSKLYTEYMKCSYSSDRSFYNFFLMLIPKWKTENRVKHLIKISDGDDRYLNGITSEYIDHYAIAKAKCGLV